MLNITLLIIYIRYYFIRIYKRVCLWPTLMRLIYTNDIMLLFEAYDTIREDISRLDKNTSYRNDLLENIKKSDQYIKNRRIRGYTNISIILLLHSYKIQWRHLNKDSILLQSIISKKLNKLYYCFLKHKGAFLPIGKEGRYVYTVPKEAADFYKKHVKVVYLENKEELKYQRPLSMDNVNEVFASARNECDLSVILHTPFPIEKGEYISLIDTERWIVFNLILSSSKYLKKHWIMKLREKVGF